MPNRSVAVCQRGIRSNGLVAALLQAQSLAACLTARKAQLLALLSAEPQALARFTLKANVKKSVMVATTTDVITITVAITIMFVMITVVLETPVALTAEADVATNSIVASAQPPLLSYKYAKGGEIK